VILQKKEKENILLKELLGRQRYNAKGVLTKTDQTNMEDLKLPAVTICPRF